LVSNAKKSEQLAKQLMASVARASGR
jgi:hypothetical protein